MLNHTHTEQPSAAASATVATPEPLSKAGTSMAEYPLQALGILEKPVRACAELSNAHIATCAQSALAMASLAVQGLANVRHPNGSSLPISLFLITIAGSGDGKTASDRFMTGAIKARELELAKSCATHNEAEDSKPRLPILVCEEPTFEGLYRVLQEGYPSQGIFSDEGGQFVGGHGMNHEAKTRMLTNLSSLWDGRCIKRIRASGISTLHGKRLSLHLMLQPVIAAELFANDITKLQGFSSRCLMVHPTSVAGKRFYQDSEQEPHTVIKTYETKMLELLRQPLKTTMSGYCLTPRDLELTETQKATWVAFQHEIESQRGEGQLYHPAKEFAAKISEHALRLAAILTLAENPTAMWLTDEALANGITLARFYLGEALRLEYEESTLAIIRKAEKILGWLQVKKFKTFTIRDIGRFGPGGLRTKEEFMDPLNLLVEHRWVIAPTEKGQPYRLYNT